MEIDSEVNQETTLDRADPWAIPMNEVKMETHLKEPQQLPFTNESEIKVQVISLMIRQLVQYGFVTEAKSLLEASKVPTTLDPENALEDIYFLHKTNGEFKEGSINDEDAHSSDNKEEENVSSTCDYSVNVDINPGKEEIDSYKDPYLPTIKSCLVTHHCAGSLTAAFSPDGEFLASGSRDTSIKVVGLSTINRESKFSEHRPVTRTFQDHTGQINDLVFHPAGTVIASASEDETIKFFDTSKHKVRRSFRHIQVQTPVRSLSFHPSGDYILAATSMNKLILYDVSSLKGYTPPNSNVLSPVVRYSPDGKLYATGAPRCSVSLWDTTTGELVRTISLEDRVPVNDTVEDTAVSWSHDGKQIAVCSEKSEICVWDIGTGRLVHQFSGSETRPLTPSVSFGVNDKFLFGIDGEQNGVVIWHMLTGTLIKRIPAHEKAIRWVVGNPKYMAFASCGDDYKSKYWKPVPEI